MTIKRRFIIDKSLPLMFAYLHINEQQVLSKANLPIDLFTKATISLSADEYYRLWIAMLECYASEVPIPLLIEKIPIHAAMNVPIMAALCAADMITFAERIKKYKPLIGPLLIENTLTDDSFSIEIKGLDDEVKLHPTVVQIETIFFTKMIRYATKKEVIPLSIETIDPITDKAFVDYFKMIPTKGEKNIITFSLEDSQHPFEIHDEVVWQYLEPQLQKRLDELERDSSFSARVRSSLMELLPMGKSTIGDVADKLCMSIRTLQRRLKAEDTTFQQQLNHSRELLAKHYLLTSELSVSEIGFLLGFDEPSSFTRAFSLWTGNSPESFRHKEKQ